MTTIKNLLPFLILGSNLMAEDMSGFLQKLKEPQNQVLFCRKGFGFLTPSIRAGSGEECQRAVGATLAEYICEKHGDYEKSECHRKAQNLAVRSNVVGYLSENKKDVCQVIEKTISSLASTCHAITNVPIPGPASAQEPTIKPNPIGTSNTPATTAQSPKPIDNITNPTQYATMGIEYLHQKGLLGQGVKVGIIDEDGSFVDPRISEMKVVYSSTPPGNHATFVAGIIAGKKPTSSNIRIGIAPLSSPYFKESVFTQDQGYSLKIKLTEPHFIYDSGLDALLTTARASDTLNLSFIYTNKVYKLDKAELVEASGTTIMLPTNFVGLSETNMLKDRRGDVAWFKLLENLTGKITEAGPKDELKKIDNFMNLMQFLNKRGPQGAALKKTVLYALLVYRSPAVLTHSGSGIDSIKGVWEHKLPDQIDKKFAEQIDSFRQQGVLIINISLGFGVGQYSKPAIKRFGDAGGIIVTAAGNLNYLMSGQGYTNPDPKSNSLFGALLEEALKDKSFADNFILVGALEPSLQKLTSFSTRAGDIAPGRFINAWGQKVTSYDYGKGTAGADGTSFSAPIVTGILTLLKEAFPKCSPRELANFVLTNADSLGANQFFLSGKGRINAQKAYNAIAASGRCK